MKSVRKYCPEDKSKKLQVCPVCHFTPCQCNGTSSSRWCRTKKSKKMIRKKKPVYSSDRKDCNMAYDRTKTYLDLCTQELVNLCWLLLTPDSLNRLKNLLHDNHGYSIKEAEEYLEKKRACVWRNLRFMAMSRTLTPFGCNVMSFLLRSNGDCCQEVPCSYTMDTNQSCAPLKLLQNLVQDIRDESSRYLICAAQQNQNNTSLVSQEMFTPWKRDVIEKDALCSQSLALQDCFESYDKCFRCLKKILSKNQPMPSESSQSGFNMKAPNKSRCEPEVNGYTELKPQNTQTKPISPMNTRTQSVQTTLTGDDISFEPKPTSPKKTRIQSVQTTLTGNNISFPPESEISFIKDDAANDKMNIACEVDNSDWSSEQLVKDLDIESRGNNSLLKSDSERSSFFGTSNCEDAITPSNLCIEDSSEYKDAEDTEMRTSVSIIKRPSDDSSYYTSLDGNKENRVQFFVDFNEEEDAFHSADSICSDTGHNLTFHFNRHLEMSQIPHAEQS